MRNILLFGVLICCFSGCATTLTLSQDDYESVRFNIVKVKWHNEQLKKLHEDLGIYLKETKQLDDHIKENQNGQ